MAKTIGLSALLGVGCVLAACSASPPLETPRGVGFGNYDRYLAGQAQVSSQAVTSRPAAPAQGFAANGPVPSETPGAAVPQGTAIARAGLPAPGAPTAPTTDFAARAAAAIDAADGGSVTRGAIPNAPRAAAAPGATAGASLAASDNTLVQYAINTGHPIGVQQYRRTDLGQARHVANCGEFASAEAAQLWFLANEGPARDQRSLDPDGDGFACAWDPSGYRQAAALAAQGN